ncbi:MAG: hypothetical protein WBG86_17285, partial [Polyangiales bacterium]
GQDTLFGRMLVAEEMRRYRLENIMRRRPSVLVVGTSTVMEFRGQVFGSQASESYNAGGVVQQIEHLLQLVPVLKEAQVRSVLVGLDFWWFNENWQTYRLPDIKELRTRAPFNQDLQARLHALRSLGSALTDSDSKLADALERHYRGEEPDGYFPIGLQAQLGAGFRGSDGSRRYPRAIQRSRENAPYEDGMKTLERIMKRKQQFVGATRVSRQALAVLRQFIEECHRAGIKLAFVLPPIAPSTYRAMMASPDHHDLLTSFSAEVTALLESSRVPYVSATVADSVGVEEQHMLDGLHGSEVAMARVFLALLRSPGASDVFPGSNPATLERSLATKKENPREVEVWSGYAGPVPN